MPSSQSNEPVLLQIRGLIKRFGGVTALGGVNLDLHRGEIHALLGENGAGKSTLIKILAGVHRPDAGDIQLDRSTVQIQDVRDAERLGIRVIHQELSLVPNLSVAENIFLGREPSRCGWLDRNRMFQEAATLVDRLQMPEISDVRKSVNDLSVAHRQLVEIARALSCQARILILDEPTSSLSQAETNALFVTLRRLRASGVAIIYISHRLEEIMQLADRITVLRDGLSIGTRQRTEVNQRELIEWMVGRNLVDYFHRPQRLTGSVALEVSNLRNAKIHGVSFTLHYGEVLGLAGLVGAGRSELARALFGIDRLQEGEVRVDGQPLSLRNPRAALEAGIVLVPEDRRKEGLVLTRSVAFNLALPWAAEWNHGCFPDFKRRAAIVEKAIRSFGIKTSDAEQRINELSGGNQQKALIARWMEHPPKILILDEPTRGVDVGAREELSRIIGSLLERGMAVLLISSDLVEVMSMSHRIGLYRDGTLLKLMEAKDASAEEVMLELTAGRTYANN